MDRDELVLVDCGIVEADRSGITGPGKRPTMSPTRVLVSAPRGEMIAILKAFKP